jgi:hypothetical protein
MSKPHRGLRLSVVAPCREDWNQMTGGDDVRFCGRCRQNVYNLSEMSESQVRELVQGRACVRFFARADGTVVTRKCPPMLLAARRRLMAIVACLVPLVLGFWGSVMWLHDLIHGGSEDTMGLTGPRAVMGAARMPLPPIQGGIAPPPPPTPRHHRMGKPVAPRALMGEPAPFIK